MELPQLYFDDCVRHWTNLNALIVFVLSYFCFHRTVLLLVNMLVEYCQCVDDTPILVTDIMNKLFETLKVSFIFTVRYSQ